MRVLPSVFGSLMLMAFAISPLSANASIDEDAILHEVREFYAGYIRSYTSQKSQDLADNYMIAPLYFRNFEDVVFLQNRQEVVDYLASVFSKMTDQDYESSEILANNFCVLTETSAIVSIAFRRFNSNGDTILESGASYSLFKFDGSWRIAMLSSHPSENIVSCEGSGKLSIWGGGNPVDDDQATALSHSFKRSHPQIPVVFSPKQMPTKINQVTNNGMCIQNSLNLPSPSSV